MTTQNTLLAHIVPMYGKTELVATEALRYILEQSGAARKALESMLRASGVEVSSLTRSGPRQSVMRESALTWFATTNMGRNGC